MAEYVVTIETLMRDASMAFGPDFWDKATHRFALRENLELFQQQARAEARRGALAEAIELAHEAEYQDDTDIFTCRYIAETILQTKRALPDDPEPAPTSDDSDKNL